MRKLILVVTSCVLLFVLHGQAKLFPAIKDYGGVFDVPFAKDKPDSSVQYRIIIEAGSPIEKPEEIYPPLEHVSRLYNLHIYSGIPQKNLHVELVVFGPSIAVVLDDDAYKKKFGTDNPNLKIIEEMTKAGIKIHACGQSVMLTGIDTATINSNIDVVVSRFTTVSSRQMQGYAFFKF